MPDPPMPRADSPLLPAPAKWILFSVVGAVGLGLVLARRILTVDSGETKGDVLVVLGGGGRERREQALRLFQEGAAPKIMLTGRGDTEARARWLMENGVPAQSILREEKAASTLENAKYSIALLREMDAHRVILVTSWYHSRRALACFRHFSPPFTLYSRPSHSGHLKTKNDRHGGATHVAFEYLKLPGYWFRYGVDPFAGGPAAPGKD